MHRTDIYDINDLMMLATQSVTEKTVLPNNVIAFADYKQVDEPLATSIHPEVLPWFFGVSRSVSLSLYADHSSNWHDAGL